jgi:hypothetical protein
MTLVVVRRPRAAISADHDEVAVKLRLRYPGKWFTLELLPRGRDEPAWRKYQGKVAVKAPKNKFDGDAKWVITRHRLVIVAHPGLSTAGLNRPKDEHALMGVDLRDLSSPEPRRKKLGTAFRRLRVTGVSEEFTIELGLSEKLYENLVQALSGGAQELDDGFARKLNERDRKREEAERQARVMAEHAAAEIKVREARELSNRFKAKSGDGVGPLGGLALRSFDHKRTWRFRVAATPKECLEAFERGFSKQVVVLRARWEITRSGGESRAIYRGRGGIMRAVTGLSKIATAEQDGAVGSEVKFVVDGTDDGHTVCSMWLAEYASRIGFTNDARFIRPYLRAVENELRAIDPVVGVLKE